jgi:methylase of polypeptide subunit release factors
MSWDVAPSLETLALLSQKSRHEMIWGGCHLPLGETLGYLIWDKQIDGLNFGETEFCWTDMRFAPRIFHFRAVGIDNGRRHPTQKPVELMQWCFRFLPDETLPILDPFCGSGTTLVAARKLGRHFLGMEISPEYCAIARKRLAEIDAQPNLFEPKPEQLKL